MTSNFFGRNACLSEEVTFTCTAQGTVLFWRNEAFGEMAIDNQSPYSGRGLFRAALKSYDSSQNCLVSTLIFHATASRNRTRVMCTNDNKSSNQSLSLHIMSELTLHDTFLSVLQGQGSLIISFSSLGWELAGHVCLIFTNRSLPTPIHQQRCNSQKK